MPPLDPLAVPRGTCAKCGLVGKHIDVLRDCVPALRDALAELSLGRKRNRPGEYLDKRKLVRMEPRLPVRWIFER